MVGLKLVILLTWLVIGQWNVDCENEPRIDWSLYQRLQTLQIGLVQNKNLNKYANLSDYSADDNDAFIHDSTRVKRSYNTEKCIKDLQTIQKAFNDDSSDWANEMFGAWGKVPSVGIDKDFGNFDLCHDLKVDESINIETQYCLANIRRTSFYANDIIPNEANVGICIPNSCAPSFIATILDDYLNSKGTIGINIWAGDCRFKNDNTTVLFTHKLLIACATAILGLVILSSIYDVLSTAPDDEKNPVLLAFSAYTNAKNLFACRSNQSPNVIPCLDGFRVIASLSIVAVHSAWYQRQVEITPSNKDYLVDDVNRIFNAARFSLDTFFVMSAMLATNKMLHELSTTGRLNIPLLYIQRILRLSPALTVVALFNIYFIQFCANGPLYNFVNVMLRHDCENSPWPTLFYYNNYVNIECVPGSWFLSTDMQFYLLTPFLAMLMHHFPKLFMSFPLAITFLDLFDLAPDIAYFRVEEDYFSLRARIVPWMIGVVIAYILFQIRSKKQFQIPKYLNILLLVVSMGVMTNLLYASPELGRLGSYLLRNRALWSLCIGYVIFACVNGQGGIINRFLSHPIWQPLSRLSFNVYLVQLGLIEVMYGNKKVTWYYSLFSQMQDFFTVLIISCGLATILSLTIEMPISNLSHRYVSRKRFSALVARILYCFRLDQFSKDSPNQQIKSQA